MKWSWSDCWLSLPMVTDFEYGARSGSMRFKTVRREKVGRKIGTLEPEILWRAEQMLAIFLGFSV
jgi:hypothetical protein